MVKIQDIPNLQYRRKASIRFQNYYFRCSGTSDPKPAQLCSRLISNFDESADANGPTEVFYVIFYSMLFHFVYLDWLA